MTTLAEKGISKYWTSALEALFDYLLDGPKVTGPNSFARRAVLLTLRDTLKYDDQTPEGERALAANRLRLAIATDDELLEMAECWHSLECDGSVEECLEELKQGRENALRKGAA